MYFIDALTYVSHHHVLFQNPPMQELYEHHFCAVYNSGLSVQSNWYDAARLAADEEPDSIEIVLSFNNIVDITYYVFYET